MTRLERLRRRAERLCRAVFGSEGIHGQGEVTELSIEHGRATAGAWARLEMHFDEVQDLGAGVLFVDSVALPWAGSETVDRAVFAAFPVRVNSDGEEEHVGEVNLSAITTLEAAAERARGTIDEWEQGVYRSRTGKTKGIERDSWGNGLDGMVVTVMLPEGARTRHVATSLERPTTKSGRLLPWTARSTSKPKRGPRSSPVRSTSPGKRRGSTRGGKRKRT